MDFTSGAITPVFDGSSETTPQGVVTINTTTTACVVGAAVGVIIYNGYQIYSEFDAFMNGRKIGRVTRLPLLCNAGIPRYLLCERMNTL